MEEPSDRKKEFNEAALRTELDRVINRLPGLKDSLAEHNIDLSKLKKVHIFGYGSLPSNPHYEPTHKERAYLYGYRKDLCCKSVRSGTPKFPGITMGIEEADDGIVKGAVMEYEDLDLKELVEMLKLFADREVPSVPIYRFKMVDVEMDNGKKVMAITCVADTSSDAYIGDALSDEARKNLSEAEREEASLYRKAAIIAQADGPVGTNKSYMDRFITYYIDKNPADPPHLIKDAALSSKERKRKKLFYNEQQRLKKLIAAVNDFRKTMPKPERERLEKIEKRQWSIFIAGQNQQAAREAEKDIEIHRTPPANDDKTPKPPSNDDAPPKPGDGEKPRQPKRPAL